MIQYVHKLSAFLFFLLGSSFFGAYLLYRNDIGEGWPRWWLAIADLPLALVAVIYGGTSLYLSLRKPDKGSKVLAAFIIIPLVAIFTVVIVLNFWNVLGLPVGEGL